jgi:hypothetical protein
LSNNQRLDEKYEKQFINQISNIKLKASHFDLGMEIIDEKGGSNQSMLFNKNILNPSMA